MQNNKLTFDGNAYRIELSSGIVYEGSTTNLIAHFAVDTITICDRATKLHIPIMSSRANILEINGEVKTFEQAQTTIEDALSSAGGASRADAVSYDNTTSGLQSTNVQGAIDEVGANLGELGSDVNALKDASEVIYNSAENVAYGTSNVKAELDKINGGEKTKTDSEIQTLQNYRMQSNGKVTSATDRSLKIYNLSANVAYRLTIPTSGNQYNAIAVTFDLLSSATDVSSNPPFPKSVLQLGTGSAIELDYTPTTNEYLRVCYFNESLPILTHSEIELSYDDRFEADESEIESIKNGNNEISINISPSAIIEGYRMQQNGIATDITANNCILKIYRLEVGKTYKTYLQQTGNQYNAVAVLYNDFEDAKSVTSTPNSVISLGNSDTMTLEYSATYGWLRIASYNDIDYTQLKDKEKVTEVFTGIRKDISFNRDLLNFFEGKKMITIGDSITEGCTWQPKLSTSLHLNWSREETTSSTQTSTHKEDEIGNVCYYNGSNYYKFGNDGSIVSVDRVVDVTNIKNGYSGSVIQAVEQGDGKQSIFWRAKQAQSQNADIIVLFGGTNDAPYLLADNMQYIGSYNDDPYYGELISGGIQQSYQSVSFCSSYKGIVEMLIRTNPNAYIVCLGLYRWMNDEFVSTYTKDVMYARIDKINDEISKICDLYGIKFVELSRGCGFNYFANSSLLRDGLHPSKIGGERIAERIAKEI